MYTIHKSANFTDQLELKDAAGKSLILDIHLGITPQLARDYRALQVKILNLQNEAKAAPGDAAVVEKIGEAVSDVLTLLFGADNVQKMASFYAGDYISMLTDVFPYIQEVIAPQFIKLAKERRQQLKRRFK